MASIYEIDTDEGYTSSTSSTGSVETFKEKVTNTIIAQNGMTEKIANKKVKIADSIPKFLFHNHYKFLKGAIDYIHTSHQSLDSSRAWICFWTLHALDLLGKLDTMIQESSSVGNNNNQDQENDKYLINRAIEYLQRLQQPKGGFAGGVDQVSHVVSTFAAVNALMVLGSDKAYQVVDRKSMYNFLMNMKTSQGSFRTQEDGEDDSRSTYCAITIATLLNIQTKELFDGVAEYLVSCQTYEGGFGGQPDNEAHGGYTYCAIAALSLLNSLHMINIDSLLRWLINRQPSFDGGFQGRTNKLVDTCYSFWQGAVFPIIQAYLYANNPQLFDKLKQIQHQNNQDERQLYNQSQLQEYCLISCQDQNGGFGDHPEKNRDYYHTCYTLSGLSISQYNDIYLSVLNMNGEKQEECPSLTNEIDRTNASNQDKTTTIYKVDQDQPLIEPTHPIFNIQLNKCLRALRYFKTQPLIQ